MEDNKKRVICQADFISASTINCPAETSSAGQKYRTKKIPIH